MNTQLKHWVKVGRKLCDLDLSLARGGSIRSTYIWSVGGLELAWVEENVPIIEKPCHPPPPLPQPSKATTAQRLRLEFLMTKGCLCAGEQGVACAGKKSTPLHPPRNAHLGLSNRYIRPKDAHIGLFEMEDEFLIGNTSVSSASREGHRRNHTTTTTINTAA